MAKKEKKPKEPEGEAPEGAEGVEGEAPAKKKLPLKMLIIAGAAALVVLGGAGYLNLDVDRFPSVDIPVVRVSARLPGASPAEMESLVAQPIEEVLNTIEGVDELRSINGAGSTFIIVTFNLDREIDVAAQDVRDRVSSVLRELPRLPDGRCLPVLSPTRAGGGGAGRDAGVLGGANGAAAARTGHARRRRGGGDRAAGRGHA